MSENPDTTPLQAVLCFSHLRWNFVYQRPQHLLTRLNRQVPVHFWEEPVFGEHEQAHLLIVRGDDEVTVITPILPHGLTETAINEIQQALLDDYMSQRCIVHFLEWFYTPMALGFAGHLVPEITVYDCMDELAAFQGAPAQLLQREQELFLRADIVFAGGASLYESKKTQHRNVYQFPSSIDKRHFAAARRKMEDPQDQSNIPHPRIGFFGVLDERLDRELIQGIAALRPDWHFILVGPVAKIQQSELPAAANIHYLGSKQYRDLPSYLAGWDVAILPFARNSSTRFISPTKTPEYLSAGKPVVSTSIRDVVRPYGEGGLVQIADTPEDFITAITSALQPANPRQLAKVDEYLSSMSWDKTFQAMMTAIAALGADRSVSARAGLPEERRSGSHV